MVMLRQLNDVLMLIYSDVLRRGALIMLLMHLLVVVWQVCTMHVLPVVNYGHVLVYVNIDRDSHSWVVYVFSSIFVTVCMYILSIGHVMLHSNAFLVVCAPLVHTATVGTASHNAWLTESAICVPTVSTDGDTEGSTRRQIYMQLCRWDG
eukprot:GFYU01057731.1.p2 GENE.GFYU01057731.1~~GFYU01057731.1.p2  ORF type:complete len:150 (-),score=34.27 GFYU01057731.1:27-476(-)